MGLEYRSRAQTAVGLVGLSKIRAANATALASFATPAQCRSRSRVVLKMARRFGSVVAVVLALSVVLLEICMCELLSHRIQFSGAKTTT